MSNAPAIFRVSLEVADSKRAHRFYSKLLGIEGRLVGGGRVYFDCGPVILALVDVSAGKKRPKPAPQDVYFAVEDVDATAAKATDSGGGVALAPFDIAEVGRIAIVKDPFGAVFAVMTPDPNMGAG